MTPVTPVPFAVSAQRPTPRDQPPVSSPRPLGRFLPRIRPYRGRLLVAFVCLLLASGIALAFPQIVRHLLDAAFVSADASLLNSIAISLLIMFAIQAVLNFVQVYLLTSTSERVIAQLRQELFAHLVHLSPGFFTERRTGELTSRLSADTTVLQTVLSYNLSEFARQTLFLIGGIVLLTMTHPLLTATTLAVVPLVVGAAFFFGRALRRASTGVQDRIAEATGTAEEAFSQIRTVQSYTREDEEVRRYGSHLDDVIAAAMRRAGIRGAFFGTLTFSGFGAVVAVLWQGGRLVLDGTLTPGALVSFLLYALYVAGAVGSLASLFGAYQEAVGAARRVFDLLETESAVRDPVSPARLPRPVRGEVAMDNVSFRYSPSLPEVLHGISLRISAGEVVALVGPSGAGKTTVASLLAHRRPPPFARRSSRRDRNRSTGADAVQRHDQGEHRLCGDWPGRIASTGRSCSRRCKSSARGGVHRPPPGRIRYEGWRTRSKALRRTTPAHCDRAGFSQEPGAGDTRRSDVESRQRERKADRGGHGATATSSFHAHHRTPAEHGAAGGSGGGIGSRGDRRGGQAC